MTLKEYFGDADFDATDESAIKNQTAYYYKTYVNPNATTEQMRAFANEFAPIKTKTPNAEASGAEEQPVQDGGLPASDAPRNEPLIEGDGEPLALDQNATAPAQTQEQDAYAAIKANVVKSARELASGETQTQSAPREDNGVSWANVPPPKHRPEVKEVTREFFPEYKKHPMPDADFQNAIKQGFYDEFGRFYNEKAIDDIRNNQKIQADENAPLGSQATATAQNLLAYSSLPFNMAVTGYGDLINTAKGDKRSFEKTQAERTADRDTYLSGQEQRRFFELFPAGGALGGLLFDEDPNATEDYENELVKHFGDKYELNRNEEGIYEARPKGRKDLDFKPMGGEFWDGDSIVNQLKAYAPTWVPELAIDLGAYVTAKKAFGFFGKFKDSPKALNAASAAIAIGVSPIGALVGTEAQLAYSGQNVSPEEKRRILTSETLFNAVAAGVGYALPSIVRGTRDAWNKITPARASKNRDLYIRGQFRTDDEWLRAVQERAEFEAFSELFGAKQPGWFARTFTGARTNQLGDLVGMSEARDTLGSFLVNNPFARRTAIEDSDTLMKNLLAKLDLSPQASRDAYNFIHGGMRRAKKIYENVYGKVEDYITENAGGVLIRGGSKTLKQIEKAINDIETVTAMSGEKTPLITEFNKDASTTLQTLRAAFNKNGEIADEFNIEGLFRLQKTLNEFYGKHSERFTYEQHGAIKNIREAVYADIETAIKASKLSPEEKATLIDRWAYVNKEYSNYKRVIQDTRIIRELLEHKEFNAPRWTEELITSGGMSDADNRIALAKMATIMRQTQPQRMKKFYGAIVNGMLNASKREFAEKGAVSKFYVDWAKYRELWGSIDKSAKEQIFGDDVLGRNFLGTLNGFDRLAAREELIQKVVFAPKASEASKGITNFIRTFLFSGKYAVGNFILKYGFSHVNRSAAFQYYLNAFSAMPRFDRVKNNALINKLAHDVIKNPENGMTLQEVARFRSAVKAMESFADNMPENTPPREIVEQINQATDHIVNTEFWNPPRNPSEPPRPPRDNPPNSGGGNGGTPSEAAPRTLSEQEIEDIEFRAWR
ncbi:MAG: hypothetical protein LBQ52_03095 [Helicobacteraceae bacterium]|jgi:hypothetical protein|nr:hypothetical protein [Helicobacteraceae bacterium]